MKEMLSLHGHGPRVTLLPQFPSARTFQHFLPVTCKVSPSQVPPLGWFCSQWCPQTCAELTPDPFYTWGLLPVKSEANRAGGTAGPRIPQGWCGKTTQFPPPGPANPVPVTLPTLLPSLLLGSGWAGDTGTV